MIEKHPIFARISVVITIITLATGVAGGYYFLSDEHERSIQQSTKLDEIRHEQEFIRKELATQSVLLTEIKSTQSDIINSSNQRFTMRADEHRWLASEINKVLGSMAINIGELNHHDHK